MPHMGRVRVPEAGREPGGREVVHLAGAPILVWALGLVVGVVLLGPGLGPGALMNLDLLLFDRTPVPSGVWGLGPELPRRLPLWLPITWAGAVGLSGVVGKFVVLGAVVLAFVGTYRLSFRIIRGRHASSLLGGSTTIAAVTSAVLYATSPFLLTRVAVGHWPVVVTMAVLPWALSDLLSRRTSLRRIGLWAVLFGFGGVYGATIGGAFLLAGFVGLPRGQVVRRGLVWVAGQSSWLVAMAVVATTTPDRAMAPSEAFASQFDGVGDLGRLFVGLGFWNTGFQLGLTQPVFAAVCGVLFAVLTVVGLGWFPPRWRRRCGAVAAVAFVGVACTTLPVVDDVFSRFTDTFVGAPFREPQRNLAPLILLVALCVPLGALRVTARLPGVLAGPLELAPMLLGIALVLPSAWGLEGQLRPVSIPEEWAEARAMIEDQPGTVVALPWFQYFTADVADDRLVLSPLPTYLGGDVISSSDPQIGDRPAQEVGDPREPAVARIVAAARQGTPVSADLAAMGVRWVALLHDVDWRLYTGVAEDEGLRRRISGETLTLYEVEQWPGAVSSLDGREVDANAVVAPMVDVASSGPAVYAAPFQRGWLRGTRSATAAESGQILLPGGSGPVWYGPTLLVLVGNVSWMAMVGWILGPNGHRHRHRHR